MTTILPTFRIASACSDEDILSSNENEEMVNTNASSDECLNSTVINNDNAKTGQTLNTMKTLKNTGEIVNSNKLSTTNLTKTKDEIR